MFKVIRFPEAADIYKEAKNRRRSENMVWFLIEKERK